MNGSATVKTSDVLLNIGFEHVGEGVSFYKALNSEKADDQHTTDPSLLIICSWAFAQPKHIVKYIIPYQTIFPTTSILLVQNAIGNAIWRPDAWQHAYFEPAVTLIQRHLLQTSQARILVHTFSNGGSHAAVQLSQMCREVCGGLRLPVDALIMDSAPGIPRFGPTIKALTLGMPSKNPLSKAIAALFAYGSVGLTAALDMLNLAEPAAWKLYRVLNDPYDVFLLKGNAPVPRTYIYSRADEMIMEEDVLEHARIAKQRLEEQATDRQKADKYVRVEEFVETAHVNHIKNEPERYWNIVQDTWSKAITPADL